MVDAPQFNLSYEILNQDYKTHPTYIITLLPQITLHDQKVYVMFFL